MTRVWLWAVLLCLAGILVVANLPGGEIAESTTKRFELAIRQLDPVPDIMVLGSSLSLMAVPPHLRTEAAPGSDVPALVGLRMTLPCAQSDKLVRLLDMATKRGVSNILLEINPFLFDVRGCHWATGLRAKLSNLATALRWRIESAIFGADSTLAEVEYEPHTLEQIYDGDERMIRPGGEVTLRSPDAFDLLEPVLAAGRHKGLNVILVVMPRSETASRLLGAAFDSQLDSRLADLRDRFANRVWEPARFWPDRYFADRAHMNEAGRQRFVAELRHAIGAAR